MSTRIPSRLEGVAWRLSESETLSGPALSRRRIASGDLIVCDGVFGRELRVAEAEALAALGLSGIVARSFDPEFHSAATEAGLLLLANPRAAAELPHGSRTRVDVETGLVHDVTTGEWYRSIDPARSAAM